MNIINILLIFNLVFILLEVKIVFYLSIFVFGLFGNFFVIIVLVRKRFFCICYDIFICNFVIFDLIFFLIYFFMFFVYVVGNFKVLRVFCKLIWLLIIILYFFSILIIIFMVIYCFRMIVNFYIFEISWRNVYIWIFCLWIMLFVCILFGMVFVEVNWMGMCYVVWFLVEVYVVFWFFMLMV